MPKRDRLAAVGEPALREALLFARRRREPFTIDEAARALGVHRNVARSRLDRLVEGGFLSTAFERRTGRAGPGAGRPAKVYRVAPELEATEFPARRYQELVRLLAKRMPPGTLREVGEAFGRELAAAAALRRAKTLRGGLDRICAALGRLGFQAHVVEVEPDRAVLASATCPLRPLVVASPAAKAIDRGMWAALLERAVKGVRAHEVGCETKSCRDRHSSCRILLTLRQKSDASAETVSR